MKIVMILWSERMLQPENLLKIMKNEKKRWFPKGFRAIVTYFCNETMFSCLVCVNARNTYIMMQV